MSKIEWTHRPGTKSEVWNPTTGCDKVSQGCKFCYAEVMHKRLRGMGQKKYQHPFLGHFTMHEDEIMRPLRWQKPRTVFVDSMSDLFHKDVTWAFLDKVFAVMVGSYQHTYQILTKRADLLYNYFAVGKDVLIQHWADAALEMGISPDDEDPDQGYCAIFTLCEHQWPRPNIWIGVSAEDQLTYDERVVQLMLIDAYVRFVSYEPAQGYIDITSVGLYESVHRQWSGLPDWIIAGGESGAKARPAHPDWFRAVRDRCKEAGVAFFFKQWGEWAPDHHVSYNGPFDIRSPKHYVIDIDGRGNFYHSFDSPGEPPKEADPPITKKNNAWWMANVGKSESGNLLDGVQHLEYPE